MEASLPHDEEKRLEILNRYKVLDTPSESDFDDIVRLAAQICQTPVSLVSLVDRDRQWFKGRYGLEVSETPRRLSFCAHAILRPEEAMEVPDATQDPRFADNELVTGGPRIRFYAGAPLVTPEGHALGTLCVIDQKPRQLTPEQKEALRILGRQVMMQLELRRRMAELTTLHAQEQSQLEAQVQQRTAQLQTSEERFRTLADAIPQLAWTARPDGFIFWFNRRWYEYTGTTPEQVEGWGWQHVYDPQVLQRALQQWHSSIDSGQPFDQELPLRGADGRFRPFLTRVMPLKDSAGRVQLWFGTNTDVTELVAARETLARSRQELERLVHERTAQLLEANTNLQAFAHTAAHDLRSPLRSISSFAGMVAAKYRSQLDDLGRSLLARMVETTDQMDRLLNDLLEYSKVSQAELRLEKISLDQLVRQALALVEPDLQARNATVQVSHPLPDVLGHPATLLMLINNLLSNALKFVPPGVAPLVRIGAERRAPPPNPAAAAGPGENPNAPTDPPWVRLWVADNGIGIAPENMGKIFGAFQRLHDKQAYPGTGLGLAIVRKAAERMGGRVGVESELGRGSRFWVELRAA